MSFLSLALEDVDSVVETPSTPIPLAATPTMGDLLQETGMLYDKVSSGNDLVSKIENSTEHLEAISADVATESSLSQLSRTIIARTHKLLTGSEFLKDRLVALEDVDSADDEFKDSVVTEVQQATLDQFLIGMKGKFYDNWGDTKSWYSKVTSLRTAVIKKNTDTMERAAKVTGDPKTLEFTFKENVDVDNNGKVSYQEILGGVENLLAYAESRLNAKVDKQFEDFIVGCQRVVDGYKTKGEADEAELLKYKDLYTPPPEVLTSELTNANIRGRLTDSDTANLIQTRNFPGAAFIVISTPGDKSGATPYSFIDDTWVKLYTEEPDAEKVSVKVRTFYPNQIVHVSDIISKLLDSLVYFDKSWERRDRFMTKVFGSLDKTVSAIADKLTDSSQDKKTDEELRALTRVMIKSIQLDNTFNSMLINYIIKITAQLIDLNNACLIQYNDV